MHHNLIGRNDLQSHSQLSTFRWDILTTIKKSHVER